MAKNTFSSPTPPEEYENFALVGERGEGRGGEQKRGRERQRGGEGSEGRKLGGEEERGKGGRERRRGRER